MSENRDEYNGWTNRETWAVALWINNDQGWQESTHERLRDYNASLIESHEPRDLSADEAGEIVRENVEETLDMLAESNLETFRNIRDDFGSLWRVNWREIGAAFLRDALEQDA